MSKSYRSAWADEPHYAEHANTNPIADSVDSFFDGNVLAELYGETVLFDDNQTVAENAGEAVAASELAEVGGFHAVSKNEVAPSLIEEAKVESAPRGVLRFDSLGRRVAAAPALLVRPQRAKPEPQRAEDVPDYELRHLDYMQAFERVASQLRRLRAKSSRVRTAAWGQSLGVSSAKHDPRRFSRATESDWLCDVWLKAKRVLSPRDFALWRNTYYDGVVPEETIPEQIRSHIKRSVGKRCYYDLLSDLKQYHRAAESL